MKFFSINISIFFEAFIFLSIAFVVTILLTPIFTDFLFKNKIGKKIRTADYEGKKTPIYSSLHKKKEDTPTMGGVLIWAVAGVVTLVANFSRSGTLLPMFTMIGSGAVGIIDDLMDSFGKKSGGMRFRVKFIIYSLIAGVGSYWFAYRLDWLQRPFFFPPWGEVILGYWYIPIFIIALVFIAFSANQTDGLDGLAGGIFTIAFASYIIISLIKGNYPLAIFCATVTGSLLAFLWFNVYPARFFMGDTGSMSLGMTLGVIAFLTNTLYAIPFIISVMMIESISTIIQIFSKKVFRKKVFLVAPIHHHFEAKGWPETKVTMRFWIINAVTAVVGLALIIFHG